jgi:hypothetical protein
VNDPQTYWLTITNIVLGVVTVLCIAAVGIGVWQELLARSRKRAALSKLDREVSDLVGEFKGHAFDIPGLGVTMADGGEQVPEKDQRKKS